MTDLEAQAKDYAMSRKLNLSEPTDITHVIELIDRFALSGDKIFDSHMGSGSSRIAAYNMGYDFWGCEINKEYFEASEKRFEKATQQQSLFI